MAINRQRVKYPDGMTSAEAVKTCTACNGRGAVMRVRQIGPGMIQQMQSQCPDCSGTGKTMKKGVTVKKRNARFSRCMSKKE